MSDLLARIDALTDEVLSEARSRKVDALMESACTEYRGCDGACDWCDGDEVAEDRLDLFKSYCNADIGSADDIDALKWQTELLGPDHPVLLMVGSTPLPASRVLGMAS